MDAPTLQPRGSALRAGAAAGRSSAAHGADGARDGGSAGGGAARQSAAALTCNLRAPPARDGPDAYSSAPPSKRARATAASVPQQENQPPQLTQPPPEELRPVGHLLGGRTTAAMHVHRRGGAAPNRVRLSPEQRVALGSRANWLHLTPDERMLRGKNEYRGRLAAQVCTAPQLHAHAALRTVVAGPPANPPDSAPLCGEIPATHDPFALARDLSVPSLPHGLTPTRSSQVAQASAEGRERTLRKRTDSLLKEVVALRMQVGAERRVKKAKAKAAMGVVEHEVFVAAARRCKEKGLSDICGNFAKAILSTDPRAQLHLSGSYAVDLSDASSNIRRPFKNTYAALAYPMLDMDFHAELELQGHDAEATIFSAYGAGHTGFDMPGLTMDERVRRIEVVRQNMLYNVVGDSLCLPFGGGAAREKAGEPTGVRAASFRGMAATNVLAMLQGCDVLAAIRESTPPAVFATLNTRIGNTDNVEHFFSVLKKLGGYYKGDLSQAVQTFIRADHNESVAHDASRNFLTGAKTRKGGDLYENPDYVGAEKAAQFNDGTALDPLGAPALLYKEGKRDKALRAATAEDIAVRSHHQNHGIGKAAV